MAKKRKGRNKGDAAKLEMTPMIDVVFQLLIFFIVTLKQEDILSHLDVSRPAPDPESDRVVAREIERRFRQDFKGRPADGILAAGAVIDLDVELEKLSAPRSALLRD